ncbi:hypothetical protein EV132_12081 [Rhizobium sullae]|uniref:Uncharacterized protein n=1 Tax=Rhizobium sullae TaxID=50338 RepID=A0A4R3PTT1_RHISU|nr:hypothetical protein EV132_12081 [Rhizobium sullae]
MPWFRSRFIAPECFRASSIRQRSLHAISPVFQASPCCPHVAGVNRPTQQVELGAKAREDNVRGTFAIAKGGETMFSASASSL